MPDRKSSMKRILFVRRAYGFGGAEIRLLDWLSRIDYTKNKVFVSNPVDLFSERLTKRGIPATYVSLSEDQARALFGVYDPKTGLELGRGSFWQLLRAWLRFLVGIRPDAVILMDGYFFDFPLACVLAAFLVSRGRVYMTEHSSPRREFPPKTRSLHFGFIPGLGLWWCRQVLPRILPWHLRGRVSRRVLAASAGVRERIVSLYGYPRAKMGVINHGVDPGRFHPSPLGRQRWRTAQGIPERDTVLLYTARLSREKGLDKLLTVFQTLSRSHDHLWLLLAGDGPMREDVNELVAQGSSQKIRLLGHVEDVSELLQASDIYVLASESEGFGIALIEAMATSMVCVATRSDGPEGIVQHGENGFLAESGADGLLRSLEQASQLSPEQRGEMGNKARQTVLAKYRLEDAIEHALKLLDIEYAPETPLGAVIPGQPSPPERQALSLSGFR
jgi:glycosyltransferase involved in cell wall biosynthesis